MGKKTKTPVVTPTAQVIAMLDKVSAKSKLTTLHDLVITQLNPTRKYEYASFMAAASRVLLNNPAYEKLIGKVIRHSAGRIGRPPYWASGLNPIADKQPMPNWEASREIVLMTAQFDNLGLTDALRAKNVDIDKHFRNIAKFGRRSYDSATVAVNAALALAAEERVRADTATSEISSFREDIERRFSMLTISPPAAPAELTA